MSKYLLGLIGVLFIFIFILVRFCWLPERDKRINAELKVASLTKKIEVYNATEKSFCENTQSFKKKTKDNQKYRSWADTGVPDDMLKFLQQ